MDTRRLQHFLGHASITNTVRYAAMSPKPFKDEPLLFRPPRLRGGDGTAVALCWHPTIFRPQKIFWLDHASYSTLLHREFLGQKCDAHILQPG
jgi:hypothetical protein